jgi:hypothetical protein
MAKVLLVGFSVIGGNDSLAFYAADQLDPEIELSRVCLGAVTPRMLAYVLPYILEQHAPDHVILEVATSGAFVWLKAPGFRNALLPLVATCQQRGIGVGIFDMPRYDLVDQGDWVRDIHEAFAKQFALPYPRMPLVADMHHPDGAHLTPKGKEHYAGDLVRFIGRMLGQSTAEPAAQPVPVPPDASVFLPINLLLPKAETRLMDRYGFACPVLDLPEGESCVLDTAPLGIEGLEITGLAVTTNPQAGMMQVQGQIQGQTSGAVTNLRTITKSSYYEHPRFSHVTLDGDTAITVTQSAERPDIVLRKGELDPGPRLGGILGLLCRVPQRAARIGGIPLVMHPSRTAQRQVDPAVSGPVSKPVSPPVAAPVSPEVAPTPDHSPAHSPVRRRAIRPKRTLVVGFSVGGRSESYVFRASETLPEDEVLMRVALGGQHPATLRHLVDYLLDQHQPDKVVFEISTSVYFTFGQERGLRTALSWMLQACSVRQVEVAFLDLPRADCTGDKDWVRATVRDFALGHGLPYRRVALEDAVLRDGAHPTHPEGRDIYARALLALLNTAPDHDIGTFPMPTLVQPGYGFDPITALMPDAPVRRLDRYGFACPVLDLPANEAITLQARPGTVAVGVGIVTNPKAGTMQVTHAEDATGIQLRGFSSRSYYEYPLFRMLQGQELERFTLTQLPDMPTETLKQGTPDLGPRLGGVLGILYRVTQAGVATSAVPVHSETATGVTSDVAAPLIHLEPA